MVTTFVWSAGDRTRGVWKYGLSDRYEHEFGGVGALLPEKNVFFFVRVGSLFRFTPLFIGP